MKNVPVVAGGDDDLSLVFFDLLPFVMVAAINSQDRDQSHLVIVNNEVSTKWNHIHSLNV